MKRLLWLALMPCLLFGESARSLVRRGNQALKADKPDEAVKLYQESLVQQPENPYAYYDQGVAYFRKREYDLAKKQFQLALEKTPGSRYAKSSLEYQATLSRGCACFALSKSQAGTQLDSAIQECLEAIRDFENAVSLNKKKKEAAVNLKNARLWLKKLLGMKREQQKQQQNQKQDQKQDKKQQRKQDQQKQDQKQNQQKQDQKQDQKQEQNQQQKQEQQKQEEQKKQEQQKQEQQKQEQQKQEQEQKAQEQKQEEQQQAQEAQKQDKKEDKEAAQQAQEIIDQERSDKRERDKRMPGGYVPVPMDW